MRPVLRVVPLLLVLVSCPSAGHAFSWRHLYPEPASACYTEKKITAYRPVWKDRTVEVEVTRVTWKKEDFDVKVTELVQKDKLEERTVIYHRTEVKMEDREISGCLLVPECVVDPCTCCPRIVTRPAIVKQKVKVKVLRDVAEPRKEAVKVLYCDPVVKISRQTRMVPEHRKEKASRTEKFCVLEPYETTIKVWTAPPMCAPCGPLPGYPFGAGYYPAPGPGGSQPHHTGYASQHGPTLAGEPNITPPTSSPRMSFETGEQAPTGSSAPNRPYQAPALAVPPGTGTVAPETKAPPVGTAEPPVAR